MEEKHWLDYLTAFGAVATPFLVLLLTGVGWKFRKSIDRRLDLEDKLREDRINTYNIILEPFTLLLMTQAAWEHDKQNRNKSKDDIAVGKLLSLDYRRAAFKLSLVANDDVVLAYNELMQFFYSQGDQPVASDETLKAMLSLLGKLLLEIRKSMGNEATKLNHWQMLEWFMTDVRKIKNT
ncbi:hypothetical protein [Methylomonas rhizoryzae]|uniref:hypothetical protein n=1 Tax=Methylomonas rhizoryzae TaxID=2608981 RepID=UPI001232BCA5|nr:hypothetical protein [Methylomonas rhizoryzae]